MLLRIETIAVTIEKEQGVEEAVYDNDDEESGESGDRNTEAA